MTHGLPCTLRFLIDFSQKLGSLLNLLLDLGNNLLLPHLTIQTALTDANRFQKAAASRRCHNATLPNDQDPTQMQNSYIDRDQCSHVATHWDAPCHNRALLTNRYKNRY